MEWRARMEGCRSWRSAERWRESVCRSSFLNLRSRTLCVGLTGEVEGEGGLGLRVWARLMWVLGSILDPGSPAAPPPPPPLLLSSHPNHAEVLRTPTRHRRNRETAAPRSRSTLSARRLSYSPRPSSPLHPPPSQILPPRPPFPLNLRSPAVLEPWRCSCGAAGRELAKVTRRLPPSSPGIRCWWRAASRSAACLGSPDSGRRKEVGTPAAWRCSLGELRGVSGPGGGG